MSLNVLVQIHGVKIVIAKIKSTEFVICGSLKARRTNWRLPRRNVGKSA
jgi:hypothetical protein